MLRSGASEKNSLIFTIIWIFSRKIEQHIGDRHADTQTARENDYIIGYMELHI